MFSTTSAFGFGTDRSNIFATVPAHPELWQGAFINGLRKVLLQVHPSLVAKEDALLYVEKLIIQLLTWLCMKPYPQRISDVEERVRATFPTPIDKWAIDEAKDALDKFRKKLPGGIVLPYEKIQLLLKEIIGCRVDVLLAVYITAVLEYISADLFKLTGNYVKNIHHVEISNQDIRVAMCADKVLCDLLNHEENGNENAQSTRTYEMVVKDFIYDEKLFLRNMHIVTDIFFAQIDQLFPITEMFQNTVQSFNDLKELTKSIITVLEDMLEISSDIPMVGYYLEELAEDEEFHAYYRYVEDLLQANMPVMLIKLLTESDKWDVLMYSGQNFKELVQFYLPKLLRYPLWHCSMYFEYVKTLIAFSPTQADKANLEQLEGLLRPLQGQIRQFLQYFPNEKEFGMRIHADQRQHVLKEKLEEMRLTTDGFDSKYSKKCTEFLRESMMLVQSGTKRPTQRRATLFDGILMLSKRRRSSSSTTVHSTPAMGIEYKFKDVIMIRKVEIKNREDNEDMKNAFEIIPRDAPPLIFIADSCEEKRNWMADLIMLNARSMLDRTLNALLDSIEKENPIVKPPVELYRFAEEDSSENIIMDANNQIKGATILKLVEKLTVPSTDAAFDLTFMLSYRTFITPQKLVELLAERYNVPPVEEVFKDLSNGDVTPKTKEDVKRYRKQYYQPIKFRLINVIKRWIEHYYSDFEEFEELGDLVSQFLHTITDRTMQKWAVLICGILERKKNQGDSSKDVVYQFDYPPPPIEWHIMCPENEWNILTLHPVELARQITLIEYEMYNKVKPRELIGAAWTKDTKDVISSNLMKIMRQTTHFTFWLEKLIVETENMEEREAIISRLLEIMVILFEMKNFNGAFCVYSVMESAAVFRLAAVMTSLKINKNSASQIRKTFYTIQELYEDHYKKYIEMLRATTAPCVPFFGIFLTKLMHIEDGNPDFLNGNPALINFGKRRFTCDIITELLSYQNKPYCFRREPRIREFLLSKMQTSAFTEESESLILNYLYQASMKIEPRNGETPRFPRRWPNISLKSPGIKIRPPPSRPSHSQRTSLLEVNSAHSPTMYRLVPQVILPETNESHDCDDNCETASGFRPIFFWPETGSNSDSVNEQQDNGPPLPPRSRPPSRSTSPLPEETRPMVPSRDISPPPLPPRGDSLRAHHIDRGQSFILPSSPKSAPPSPMRSSQDAARANLSLNGTPRRRRFDLDFIPAYHSPNYCSIGFNEMDSDVSPDSVIQNVPLLFDKSLEFMEFPHSSEDSFQEIRERRTSSTSSQLYFSDWPSSTKHSTILDTPVFGTNDTTRPLLRSVVIFKILPPMFQFNIPYSYDKGFDDM